MPESGAELSRARSTVLAGSPGRGHGETLVAFREQERTASLIELSGPPEQVWQEKAHVVTEECFS